MKRVVLLICLFVAVLPGFSQTVKISGTVSVAGTVKSEILPSASTLFSDGFESGNYNAWSGIFYLGQTPTQTAPDIQTSVVRSGTYASHAHYHATAGEGPSHHDVNIHQFVNFGTAEGYPNGLEEFYVRYYVRFHLNAGGTDSGSAGNTMQRKTLYVKTFTGEPTEGGAVGTNVATLFARKWSIGGSAWGACAADGNQFNYGWSPPYLMTPPDMAYDTWYAIEYHIKLNTPGVADGVFEFWVDGTQYLNYTAYNNRGTCSLGWKRIQIGVQVDRQDFDPIDEERYWDDVVISSSYIGP